MKIKAPTLLKIGVIDITAKYATLFGENEIGAKRYDDGRGISAIAFRSTKPNEIFIYQSLRVARGIGGHSQFRSASSMITGRSLASAGGEREAGRMSRAAQALRR